MNDTDPEDGCQLDGSQVGPLPAGHEIDVVIAAYLQAVERGAAPDQRAILAEYPHLAAGLREFFADDGELCELLGQRSPAVPAVHPPVVTADGVEPTDSAWGGGGRDFLSGPARRLGHYELLAELARGGMGIVYKARDTRLDRLVALKMILAGQFASAEDVRRFQVEAENAARLDHPNIVPIYEVGRRGGLHYFTMKLVEGGSLCDRQARFAADPRAALELMARVADAVHYAHQRGILHRDLKPANILLDREGQPQVMDFGLARRLDADPRLTTTGAIVGSPRYMSPEQAAGRPADTRSDVYSLGVILYELVTGYPPRDMGGSQYDVLKRIAEEDVRPPAKVGVRLERGLGAVLLKCLARNPEARYGSAGDLARELTNYLAGRPLIARPPTRLEQLGRGVRRHAAALATAAAVLAVLSAVLVQSALRVRRERDIARAETREKNFLLARSLFAEADARWIADDYASAASRFGEAAGVLNELGLSPLPARIGLANAQRRVPSPLLTFAVAEATPYLAPDRPPAGSEARQLWADTAGALNDVAPRPARTFRADFEDATAPPISRVMLNRDVGIRHNAAEEQAGFQGSRGFVFELTDPPAAVANFRMRLFDVLVAVEPATVLRYRIRPRTELGRRVRVDLVFSDGSTLIESPSGDRLPGKEPAGELGRWNTVEIPVGTQYAGRTVIAVNLRYNTFDAAGPAEADLDDIELVPPPGPPDPSVPTSSSPGAPAVDTRRTFGPHRRAVNSVAFSPDDTLIASAGADGTVKLWDATTGRGLRTLVGHTQAVRGVSFTPDGLRLLSWGDDGVLRVWGPSGSVLAHQPHRGIILSAAWAVDEGSVLFSAEENCVHRWDLGDGDAEFAAGDQACRTNALAPLPGGRQVLLGCSDGVVRSRALSRGRAEAEVARHPSQVLAVAVSPESGIVASGGFDGVIRLSGGAGSGEAGVLYGHASNVLCLAFAPGGDRLLAGYADSTARLWDVKTKRLLRILGGHAGAVRGVAISRDGRFAATAADDGAVRLWSLGEEATSVVCRDLDNNPNGRAFEGLDVAPDASAALSQRSEQGPQKLWDVRAGALVATIEPGVPLFATDGRLLRLFRPPPEAPARRGVFLPDGRRVFVAGHDNTVSLWDADTGQRLWRLGGHIRPVNCLALSPDGRHALTGSWDQTARYWDLEAAREVFTLRGHTDEVLSVAVSPDSKLALTGGEDTTVRLWDLERGVELRTFAGHQGHVIAVAFAGDGRTLLSADAGGVLRAWDGPTGHELGIFPLDTGALQAAAFTPGATAFVCADERPLLRVYRFDRLDAQHALEGRANAARVALQRDAGGDALAALGEWYAFRGVDDRAADLLGRSLANGGPTPRLLLGRCYLETNPARAAAEFPWTDHLLDEAKRSPAGVEAAVRMARSLPERPVSAFSLLRFGEYLLLGGEPTKSAECLAAAVAQESHPVHHKSLGWALLACGRREEGRAQLRKALAGDWSSGPPPGADVNDWTAAYLLGGVTAEQYTARWRDGPKATMPWFYIGQRQEMEGDAPGALSSYRKSVALGERPGAEDTWTFAAYRLKVLTKAPDRP